MARLFEGGLYFLVNVILLFILINFNLEIGMIYGVMAIVDWMAYYMAFDRGSINFYPIEKDKKKRLLNVVYAMGAYVGFIFIVNFVVARMTAVPDQGTLTIFEYISSLIAGTFSASPILYGSNFLKLIVWGLLIPIIETRFFFRTLLQWAAKTVGQIGFDLKSSKTWFTMIFFGALFSVFHIVAKGITNNSSLLVTFVFGMVSTGLVLYYKESIQAILLHIITNTIATMQQLGIGLFDAHGLMIMGGMLLATWLLLFQELPLVGRLTKMRFGG